MSQTTYYEFNKPIGSDLVNPLTDTFPNWDIADSALHELNERSVANCTEVVSLGVHAISRLNTDTKFLKWIATANFTAGDTFTVDGNVVAAATASGETLSTGAYVTGAVILACLNADDSAMTVYVTGTNVASDSARLGGELPSYYATDADMSNAKNDITNIQNLEGNTSIVGIGDGTLTGAVSAINSALDKGSVSVTTDGVKTYAASLNELFAQVNLSKVTFDSKYVEDFGSSARAFRVDNIATSSIRVTSAYSDAAQYEVRTINIGSNSSAYTGTTSATGTTFYDSSSYVQPSGRVYTFFY